MHVLFTARATHALFAFTCLALLGVSSSGCNNYGCDAEDVPNMIVTVVDEQGNGVADPRLTVETQRGNDEKWWACDNLLKYFEDGREPTPSPTWWCGGDTAGTYNVRATLGEMSGRTDGVRVNMADRCHVQTRKLEVVLQ